MAALAVEELIHVDVYSVAACRQYNALNASVVEAFCQVVTLSNTLVHVVKVAGLVQANCQSHDVTAGHAAVGIVAVAGDLLNLQQNANVGLNGAVFVEVGEVLPEQALIAECQHAAHVSVAVLLSGHGECVAVREHLGSDLSDGLVSVAFLIHLDEVSVLSPASGIEYQRDVVLMRNAVDLLQVAHGNGLAANRVVGDAGEDQRNVLRTYALNQLLQLLDIHVALERVLLVTAAFRYFPQQGLVVQVTRNGTHLLDVAFGGVEVTIRRNGELLARVTLSKDVANDFHQNGLSCTALLDNKCVRALHLSCAAIEQAAFVLAQINFVHHLLNVAAIGANEVDDLLPVLLAAALEDVAEGVEQNVITGVAAVSLVAEEQACPLMIGHCSGTGVGQHINGQHAGRECELVVMSSLKSALTLLNGYFRKITDCVSEMMRCGYVQRILLAHNKLPPVVCFGGTPVVKAGFPVPALLSGQHLSFLLFSFLFGLPYGRRAVTSISTRASLGSLATSTAERAG